MENCMTELQQVISEVETLAAQVLGYLSFNRMWFEDDEEYNQAVVVVNKRKDYIINYINKLANNDVITD